MKKKAAKPYKSANKKVPTKKSASPVGSYNLEVPAVKAKGKGK